ncbi:MAG: hypothetical protein ACI4JT_02550 [Oscillospiraceae bacterium]
MESVILEISLCLIENTIIYVFLNSLLKNRFASVLPLVFTIFITSIANLLYSGLNMFIKIPLSIFFLLIGTFVLYKDKPIIKFTFILVSLYSLYIVDIILGNLISIILGKDIADVFFANIFYRLISCLIIKAVDVFIFILLYKMLYKTDKKIRNRFWVLFSVVVFVFLAISTVFLQIYPNAYQNSENAVLYTSLAVLFFVMSLIIIYFFTELSKSFQRDSKLLLLENNFSSLQEQIAVQQQTAKMLENCAMI